jgi:hypothetical protein
MSGSAVVHIPDAEQPTSSANRSSGGGGGDNLCPSSEAACGSGSPLGSWKAFTSMLSRAIWRALLGLGWLLMKMEKWRISYGPFPSRTTLVPVLAGRLMNSHSSSASAPREEGCAIEMQERRGKPSGVTGSPLQGPTSSGSTAAPLQRPWVYRGVLTNTQVNLQPNWNTLEDAVGASFQQMKPLCIFVHSDLHPHSLQVLSEITSAESNPAVWRLLRESVIFYALSVLSPETPFLKSTEFGTFPQFNVFGALGGGQGLTLISSIEGDGLDMKKLEFFLNGSLQKFQRVNPNANRSSSAGSSPPTPSPIPID